MHLACSWCLQDGDSLFFGYSGHGGQVRPAAASTPRQGSQPCYKCAGSSQSGTNWNHACMRVHKHAVLSVGGLQEVDPSGREADGMNSTLIPADYRQVGTTSGWAEAWAGGHA